MSCGCTGSPPPSARPPPSPCRSVRSTILRDRSSPSLLARLVADPRPGLLALCRRPSC
jgi:hypothetical protein